MTVAHTSLNHAKSSTTPSEGRDLVKDLSALNSRISALQSKSQYLTEVREGQLRRRKSLEDDMRSKGYEFSSLEDLHTQLKSALEQGVISLSAEVSAAESSFKALSSSVSS